MLKNMMDNENVGDKRFEYIKARISAAYPKLSGPKYDKQMSGDDARSVQLLGLR